MATIYTIEKDGEIFEIEGPDNATPEQLQAFLSADQQTQQPTMGDTLSEASQIAREQLRDISPLASTALDVTESVDSIFERGGELAAESLAGPGVTPKQIVQDPLLKTLLGPLNPFVPAPAEPGDPSLRTDPLTAALIGGGIEIAPDILAATLGTRGLGVGRAGSAVSKTRFKSAPIKQEIQSAEEAAGVVQRIPDARVLAKELDIPIKGLSDSRIVSALTNKINQKGTQLTAQQAKDASVILGDFIKKTQPQGFLGRVFKAPATTESALVTKASKKATEELRRAVPATQDPAKRLRQLRALQKALGSAGVVAAGSFVFDQFKNLFRGE